MCCVGIIGCVSTCRIEWNEVNEHVLVMCACILCVEKAGHAIEYENSGKFKIEVRVIEDHLFQLFVHSIVVLTSPLHLSLSPFLPFSPSLVPPFLFVCLFFLNFHICS